MKGVRCNLGLGPPSRRAALLGVLALLVALVGCSSPVVFTTSSLAPEQEALAYFQWIRGASADARAAELAALRAAVPVNPAQQQAKLAMLLSVPAAAPAAALAEASELLRGLQAAGNDEGPGLPADYQLFTTLWLDLLAVRVELQQLGSEQQRTVSAVQSAEDRLAELQQRYDLLSATLVSQQRDNEELRQRNAVIQGQLDALNGIERQLIQQGSGRAAGSSP
jgi:hypothetical protein